MAEITETRTKARIKQTGEVFTPIALVDEILEKLPEELFKDPTKTFLDPAAGDGNFIIRVLNRKVHFGSTIEQAVSTTYAVELMEDNVERMKERILMWIDANDKTFNGIADARERYGNIIDHNIVCANSLEFDYDSWQPYNSNSTTPAVTKTATVTTLDDLLEF